METKTTNDLMKLLENHSMDDVIDMTATIQEMKGWTFCSYLQKCLDTYHCELSQLSEPSMIQRNYVYQIADGRRKPGRDKVIALSLTIGCTVDETQRLLKLSGNGILYPKTSRDAIILKAIMQHLSVLTTNLILDELRMTTI